ncbi:hypothetical protein [Peterkaempfera sp. SMS 1(5)a]|uniref:hypothetical protein n=1 Tax=Peterkaempfera podocarpi TaxID=3232308 RepID=UPI003672F2B4
MVQREDEFSQAVFGTALRAASTLWWAGCCFRAACVAGAWVVLAVSHTGEPLRAALQLGAASAGVGIAFLHTRSAALERLAETGPPAVQRLAAHLLTTPGRATLDASGVAETIGAFLVLWLFTGLLPLPGLTQGQRVCGVLFGVLYSLSAALQAMVDPGWYSVDRRPSPRMRRLRTLLPVVFSAMLVVYLFPYNDRAAELTVPLYLALCATPFGYYPVWAGFDVMLRAAASHTVNRHDLWRRGAAVDMHSIARNAVSLLQQYVNEPDPDPREVRRLVREAMMQVEEARLDVLSDANRSGPRPFGELWALVQRTLPASERARCTVPRTAPDPQLSPVDYQIARRVLPDLLTNALAAGAARIEVRCAATEQGRITLTVADDGPGLTAEPGTSAPAHSSSRLLRHWLAAYDGAIGWRGGGHGTVAEVHWRSQRNERQQYRSYRNEGQQEGSGG